jgi:hypothetical protein
MNDGNVQQQIVDKIKNSTNILVTVSANPSVDELSAALGLTVLLNKIKKHATAVFSGTIPPAITFLDPQKTFEHTVDSLRDFIIALDKEKADHLRYKVEGDVVRIFITPYRTTITKDDLDFSQGDYNVELVLALGVKSQSNLDKALEAHGKIFHDATVVAMSSGPDKSELGSISWNAPNASSLSEMIVVLSNGLKGDKPLLDEQIASALLTGIVAATDRFSNNKTSSKVMTMAAELMGAGANQQLIASKLQEAHAIGMGQSEVKKDQPASPSVDSEAQTSKEPEAKKHDGALAISHEKEGSLEEVAKQTIADQQAEVAERAEEALSEQLAVIPTLPEVDATSTDTPQITEAEEAKSVDKPPLKGAVSQDMWKDDPRDEPMMGGTLNATTEQAHEDAMRDIKLDQNRTILTHDDAKAPKGKSSTKMASNPISHPTSSHGVDVEPSATLADIDAKARTASHEDARAAVTAALNDAPTQPTSSVGLPPLPPLPDFSTLPPLPPSVPTASVIDANSVLGNIIPPSVEEPPVAPTAPPSASSDPGQFKIPGQN